jgi:capsular polysaccharide biosynthesis protein
MSAAAAPAPPAPAAAPAAAAGDAVNPVVATAERLFIQLVAGSVVIGDNAAKMPVDAKSLAKMSLDLAKTFHDVEHSLREKPVLTTATFDANMCDFDAWNTAATTPKAA